MVALPLLERPEHLVLLHEGKLGVRTIHRLQADALVRRDADPAR